MTKYFVWVDGLQGPQPQIWDEKNKTADGKPVKTLTEPIVLNSADKSNLNELMIAYPFEAKT